MEKMILSTLSKTWILDLDGTLVKHNGYMQEEGDTLLPGAVDFIRQIPEDDFILILTSRTVELRDQTLAFLEKHHVRYDQIIFNVPLGERIIINDRKPSGLNMAVAVNLNRDDFEMPAVERVL